MRFWRPLLRSRQALLAAGLKVEGETPDDSSEGATGEGKVKNSPPSLSDLVSVASRASPSTPTVNGSATLPTIDHRLAQNLGSATTSAVEPKGRVKMSALVPKSGRSYMVIEESEDEADIASVDGSTSNPSSTSVPSSSPSSSVSYGSNAEYIAASTLALHIATHYQTPHAYNSNHPLHKSKQYKSGGKTKNVTSPTGAKKKTASKKASKKKAA